MNPLIKKTGILVLMTIICAGLNQQNLYANDDTNDKTVKKEYFQSFQSSKSSVIKTDNRYGNTTLTHWSKDVIEIKVVVESKARNENRAREAVERVTIDYRSPGNTISVTTSLKDSRNNNNGDERLTIDYFIKAPSYVTLNLEQKYGNITLPDRHDGKAELNVKYGNLYAGSFTKDIDVECKYSNVTIGDVEKMELEIGYCGSVEIRSGKKMIIDCKYSNVNIGKVNELKMEKKYGNMDIKIAEVVDLDVKYSNVTIDKLTDEISMSNLSYGTVNIHELSPSFRKVYASARYGNLNIKIKESASFKFHANSMKYGSCKIKGFNTTYTDIDTSSHYKYDINGGGKGSITYEGNNYSNISIEPLR